MSNLSAGNSPVPSEQSSTASSPVAAVTPPPVTSNDPFVAQPGEGHMDVDVEMEFVEPSSQAAKDAELDDAVNEEAILKDAQEDLEVKKKKYLSALNEYLKRQKATVGSGTPDADPISYKMAKALYLEAEEVVKSLLPAPKIAEVVPTVIEKKHSRVACPPNLPFLQLRTDTFLEKPERPVFDTVYDFCQEFVIILNANELPLDDCWERLLPACLTKEERSWCEYELKGKSYKWKDAESILLDHFDTPLRKFLNMGRVWCMKQGQDESVRTFAAKFQMARRQAALDDGVLLVLCFWWNLRPEVRKSCFVALSANYGTKMPSKIEDIIDLISVASSDSSALLRNPAGTNEAALWNEFAQGNGATRSASSTFSGSGSRGRVQKRSSSDDNGKNFKKKNWDFKQAVKDKLCFECKSPWEKGHSCPDKRKVPCC